MRKFFRTVIALIGFSAAGFAPAQAQTDSNLLKGKILQMDFSSAVRERGAKSSFWEPGSYLTLLSIERALEYAVNDQTIALVYINADNVRLGGLADAEELHEALMRVRKSGKKVVAYSRSFDNMGYYIASAADKVVLNPCGEGVLSGVATTSIYYKDLLDTLGVKVELIRHGKYKAAGEPFISNKMSAANKEQLTALTSSLWEGMCERIASARGIEAAIFRNAVEGLQLHSAQDWKRLGLVDELMHRDEMEKWLCDQFGVTRKEELKVVTIDKYISRGKIVGSKGKDKIAVIFANGQISTDEGSTSKVGVTLANQIEKAREDASVKAVVLRVNSPGGAVLTSEIIAHELDLLRKSKPLITSYGNYAASGGYWISCQSDYIFTDNSTLTGSIGVFAMVPVFGDALKKVAHLNVYNIGSDPHADMGRGIRPLSGDEKKYYQQSVESTYDRFLERVSKGRSMTTADVDALAQGRVWSGADAVRLHLADQSGTVMDAIRYAAAKAELFEEFKIVYYPVAKSTSIFSFNKKKTKPLITAYEFTQLDW